MYRMCRITLKGLQMFPYVRKEELHLTAHFIGPEPMLFQLAPKNVTPISVVLDYTYNMEAII